MFAKYQNESKNDRLIRIILGLLIGSISYLFLSGLVQTALFVLSIILLFTGITGFCLIYKLFGLRTNKAQ